MELDQSTGIIQDVIFMPSPNHDNRPDGVEIDTLVIHSISLPPGQYGGNDIGRLFTNCLDSRSHPYFAEICEMKVSSHFLINRSGKLYQFVPTQHRAWHAGVSSYNGREAYNDFSIGIELEGCDEDGYEVIQYQQLESLTRALCTAYPAIREERIVGHHHIAPDRKTDPGPFFEWSRYYESISDIWRK